MMRESSIMKAEQLVEDLEVERVEVVVAGA